jgi:DNA ligase (NAD+)
MSKDKIKELEYIITTLDTCYEIGEECINPITQEVVLDNEYDALKRQLYKLSPSSKIFNTITASTIKNNTKKVIHDPPMTSINKCNGSVIEKKEILLKWFKDCQKDHPNIPPEEFFCMSYKHDGIALSIEYKKGKLISAGLRSKSGRDGTNCTEKTPYIKGIPQTLPLPISCIIRGEVETPISVFKEISARLGEDAKANPRAHTAGAMNLKDNEEVENRGLTFTAYNIIIKETNSYNTPYYTTEIERGIWAKKELGINFVESVLFSFEKLKNMEENYTNSTYDFMIDGVVISVNNLEYQKALGSTGDKENGNPKGKIAFKFSDEIKQATVQNIFWSTGRSGTVTPVMIIDPIALEGTVVSRCTAHNVGIIKHNKIGIGSIIEIIKSGKIIPKLYSVVESKGKINIPTHCPSCSSELVEKNGADNTISLNCNNPDCPSQNIKNLDHFLSTLGVKGISEKTIEKLIDLGLVQKPGDFYNLTPEKLEEVGITERMAALTTARIWMMPNPEQSTDEELSSFNAYRSKKIKISLEKFFAAFGIKSAGNSAGETLAKKYGSWEKIKNLNIEELENIDGIGPITAREIVKFFKENGQMVKKVEENFEFEEKKSGGKFEGKTFVLSGTLISENGEGKEYFKQLIEENGGSVKGGVSRKIDYLVAGEGSGEKSAKALELDIPILSADDLEEMVG